ncbi:CTP:molybdopterin cytidylyltransferase MocA [Streptomyces canus]
MSTPGMPLRPKPPTASDAPSGMSATASAALARTLLEGHHRPTAVLTEQVDHPTTTPHRLKIKLARCA